MASRTPQRPGYKSRADPIFPSSSNGRSVTIMMITPSRLPLRQAHSSYPGRPAAGGPARQKGRPLSASGHHPARGVPHRPQEAGGSPPAGWAGRRTAPKGAPGARCPSTEACAARAPRGGAPAGPQRAPLPCPGTAAGTARPAPGGAGCGFARPGESNGPATPREKTPLPTGPKHSGPARAPATGIGPPLRRPLSSVLPQSLRPWS